MYECSVPFSYWKTDTLSDLLGKITVNFCTTDSKRLRIISNKCYSDMIRSCASSIFLLYSERTLKMDTPDPPQRRYMSITLHGIPYDTNLQTAYGTTLCFKGIPTSPSLATGFMSPLKATNTAHGTLHISLRQKQYKACRKNRR
jgi:hypothetical protein